MNAKLLFLISLVLLCILAPGAIAQGNYIPKENEELYGTWTNKENGGDWFHPQKVVVTPDGYAEYSKISDSVPRFSWRIKIDSKWTDSDGNIWYKVFVTGTSYYEGEWSQELLKLSKSGTVMERAVNNMVVEHDPANYPKEIDSHAFRYRILFRSEAGVQ